MAKSLSRCQGVGPVGRLGGVSAGCFIGRNGQCGELLSVLLFLGYVGRDGRAGGRGTEEGPGLSGHHPQNALPAPNLDTLLPGTSSTPSPRHHAIANSHWSAGVSPGSLGRPDLYPTHLTHANYILMSCV